MSEIVETIQNGLNKVWFFLIILETVLLFFLYDSISGFRNLVASMPEKNIPLRPVVDIFWMLVATVFMLGWRKVFGDYLHPKFLMRVKETDSELAVRKTEYVKKLFMDGIWYTTSCLLWVYLCYDDPQIPSSVLGSGNAHTNMDSWPLYSTRNESFYRFYWVTSLGHHFQSLIQHLIHNRETKSFTEMLQHHLQVIWLMTYSYYTNWVSIGLTVTFVHDFPDALLSFGKVIRDINIKGADLILSIMLPTLIASWWYGRIGVAIFTYITAALNCFTGNTCSSAWMLMTKTSDPLIGSVRRSAWFLVSMLICLMFLNLWWIINITAIGVRKMTQKSSKWESHHEGFKKVAQTEGSVEVPADKKTE